jgi:hypothetical protein
LLVKGLQKQDMAILTFTHKYDCRTVCCGHYAPLVHTPTAMLCPFSGRKVSEL